MNIFERIAANAARIAGNFSESAMWCAFLVIVFSVASMLGIRFIIAGLMNMHRSKTALKKLNKAYSFGQKMLLKHAWQDCLHAKKFCRFLIIWHHCIFVTFIMALLLLIFSKLWPAVLVVVGWYALGTLVFDVIPVAILFSALDRYPFQRFRHQFTFRKYHNTNDHDSLW